MNKYEFNITVIGFGETVDDAFRDVLNSLMKDPESAITNEVVYVAIGKDDNDIHHQKDVSSEEN